MDDRLDLRLLGKARTNARRFHGGEVIFREGDVADTAYVVRSGVVDIRLGERLLDRAGPGIVFGEMALIEPYLRSADAVAASDVTAYPISQLTFFRLIGERPEFTLTVLRLMTRRLRAISRGDRTRYRHP